MKLRVKTAACTILACFAQNSQSSAQLMNPVRANLYTPANTTPQQKTFWFTIPNTGTVLIALKKGETVPALGNNGQANFDYVTDNMSQYKTHFTLPAGLYFWQGNTAKNFSNRPIKMSSDGKEIGRRFISLKKGYFDANTNQTEWNATRFANNPHPFELKNISELVESKSNATTIKPQEFKAQSAIAQFSFASNNILNDKFYRMNIKGHLDSMPLTKRQALFEQAFADSQQFKNKDIIALQEWTAQGSLVVPAAYAKSSVSNNGAGLFTYYNPGLFTLIQSKFQSFTVAPDRGFLVIYLQTNDTQKRTLAVINTHFKGGAGPSGDYAGFRDSQINDIAKYITQNANQADSWILCGDFNTNSHDAKLYALLTNTLTSGAITLVDAERSAGNNRPATAYNKGGESIDYIFYTPATLDTKSVMHYPASIDQLITHGHKIGDVNKKFYSDHSITSAIFTFKNQGASASAAAAGTAASQSEKTNIKTKIESSGAAAEPATAAAGSAWTNSHEDIAKLIENAGEEDLQLAIALIRSGNLDLTAINNQGQTLGKIAHDAFEESLLAGSYPDSWNALLKLLQ